MLNVETNSALSKVNNRRDPSAAPPLVPAAPVWFSLSNFTGAGTLRCSSAAPAVSSRGTTKFDGRVTISFQCSKEDFHRLRKIRSFNYIGERQPTLGKSGRAL